MLGEVEETDMEVTPSDDKTGSTENTPAPQKNEGTMPDLPVEEDDSDDEPIIRRRKAGKMNRSILDDSESEDDGMEGKTLSHKPRPVIADSDSDDEELGTEQENVDINTDEKQSKPKNEKPKKINRSLLADSDNEDDTIGSKSTVHKAKPVVTDSDSDEDLGKLHKDGEVPSISAIKESIIEDSTKKTNIISNDIFDTGMDESDEDGSRNSGANDSDDGSSSEDGRMANSDNEDDEDGISVKKISQSLKKRLAKGAAKKPGSSRGSRVKAKEDLTQIHSESQRLVRESRVSLPYHKPEKIGLSVFLERSKHKQERLQALHAPPGRTWKVAPADLIVTPKITAPPCSQGDGTNEATCPVGKTTASDKMSLAPEASTTLDNQKGKTIDVNELDNKQESERDNLGLAADDNDLPDLLVENVPKVAKVAKSKLDTNLIDNLTAKAAEVEMSSEDVQMGVTTGKPEKNPGQDSGYLTTPTVSSEEENSHDNKSSDDSPVLQENNDKVDGSQTNCQISNAGNKTPGRKPMSKHTALTPKLACLKMLPSIKPSLSGGDFIDFDDEEEAPPKPGLLSLMDRFMKHSTKRPKKQAQDIELSLVTKSKDENDREQLTLEKMTVHVDAEEEVDPSDARPGGRRSKLKEKLQAAMKAKREVARQQRIQLVELDNEEGFEEEEEEEMSESEEEEEIEEEEEEEEMDDEEYTPAEKEKENNPFVDDEADVKEEEDEENLHLELDTQPNSKENSDGEEDAVSSRKSREFLIAALQKTKTMDLFDDDAVSDSPTMSQESTKTVVEVSERPFERLSGEASKVVEEDDLDRLLSVESSDAGDKSKESSSVNTSLADDTSASGMLSRDRDASFSSVDTSFDMMSSLIPAGQRTGSKRRSLLDGRHTPDLFSPSSKSSVGTVSTNRSTKKSRGRLSSLAMPIEDSQDLLAASPLSRTESTPRIDSQSFRFSLDDSTTHSQLLDADGLLRVDSTEKKHPRRQLMMFGKDSNSFDDMDDDLLALCSGKFSGAESQVQASSSKPMFGGMSQLGGNTQSDMNELLGLCSGQFTGAAKSATRQISKDSTSAMDDMDSDVAASQDGMDELLGLCSGKFTSMPDSPPESPPASQRRKVIRRKPVIEDDDDGDDFEVADGAGADEDQDGDNEAGLSNDEGDEFGDDEDDEEMQQAKALSNFKGFVKGKKHGKFRREFVEDEAELSGSEYDSDENLDIDERDDILEAESGDEDVMSDEELRDQVGRVHLKALIDEDKRQIRLYQEAYLADGDLHSDGNGRARKFRWKNIDEDTQQDMFAASDEEKEDEDQEGEGKWRRERHEREKFLQEQQEKEKDAEDTGSHHFKLGKVVFKPKKVLRPTQEDNQIPATEKDKGKMKAPDPPKNLFKVPKHRGSFLSRGKDTLAKIAEMNKAVSNITGPKHSKNFVFASMSQDEKDEEDKKKPQPVRRSVSCASSTQPAKRPRLERSNTIPPDSIFNFMK